MSHVVNFFDSMMNGNNENMHTCMLAKIKKFEHKKMQAEVIPLLKFKDRQGNWDDRKPILKVPVSFMYANGFFVRPPLKKDDLVILLIHSSDMDKILLTGEPQDTISNRKHDLQDSIVLANWMKFTEELPVDDDEEEDLILSHKDKAFKIKIKSDGVLEISSDKEINITSKENVTVSGPTQSSTWR